MSASTSHEKTFTFAGPAAPNQNVSRDDSDGRRPRSLFELTRRLLYVRYKTCDRRIKNVLALLVPPEIYDPEKHGVDGITKATDYIVEHNLDVEYRFFSDLKASIRDRKTMATHKYSGGDVGHAHVIEVLEYCWACLVPRRKPKGAAVTKPESDVDPSKLEQESLCNQFDMLAVEYDSDDDADGETDDERDLPQGPRARPKETPSVVHEAMYADRADITCFLWTMERLMRINTYHFETLVASHAHVENEGLPSSVMVELMMAASVASNITIQQVVALEQIFVEEHPHLNTAYRMFANLLFPEPVRHLSRLVAAKSPLASQYSDKDSIAFLGDATESSFRNRWDPNNKMDTLVPEFLSKWQFKDDDFMVVDNGVDTSVAHIFDSLRLICICEYERPENRSAELKELIHDSGMSSEPGTWLPPMGCIGKDRSITTTFRLLQTLSTRIKDNAYFAKGFYGLPWDERTEPATKILGDMDELLMHDIMLTLITMCTHSTISFNLPRQNELLTGLAQIKKFVKNPEVPVSWSLAFAAHTILTSIIDTQTILPSLAQTAQFSFLTYFQQLNVAEKTCIETIPGQPPIWDTNLSIIQELRHLADVCTEKTRDEILRSVWNPYCAGSFLSYLEFFGNLEGGITLVNSVGQLRVTLHLINALQQIGSLRLGEIKALDVIFNSFLNYNALWKGPLPVQGQFKTRWKNVVMAGEFLLEPMHISTSYRRICLRDFHGQREQKKRPKKADPMYKVIVHVCGTTDLMMEESELLAMNLVSLGTLLNRLYVRLIDVLDLMPMVEHLVAGLEKKRRPGSNPNAWGECKERMTYDCMEYVFGEVVLKHLDEGHEATASAAVSLLKRTFEEAKPASYMWFVPPPLDHVS